MKTILKDTRMVVLAVAVIASIVISIFFIKNSFGLITIDLSKNEVQGEGLERMPWQIKEPTHSLVQWSDEAIAPYIWDWRDADDPRYKFSLTEEGLKQEAEKKDPLRPFVLAFRLIRAYDQTKDESTGIAAKRALDFMLDQYEPTDRSPDGYRWFYGFAYESIPANWWSGMDALFGPLVLYAGWQQFGIERYKTEAIKSAKRALVPPTQGGVLWKDNNGCWISEYAWSGMQRKQEFQVLNGHLYGLQALYMLASVTQDPELSRAYACAREGTIARRTQFLNADQSWTWYQTTPPTINPTHYLLFETAQYRALRLVTDDPTWDYDADLRAQLFKKQYPLQLQKNSDDTYTVLFSMIGAPHPYWTDTYPVTLECQANGKSSSVYNGKHYSKEPYAQRFFVSLNLPVIPNTCSIYVHPLPNRKILAYRETNLTLDQVASARALPITPVLSYNAVGQDSKTGRIQVDPSVSPTEARITLPINQRVTNRDIIALIVNSEEETQIGIRIEDKSGNVAQREYNNILPNRDNIVLLNKIGFNGADKIFNDIASVTVRVYTHNAKTPYTLSISSLQILNNAAQLKMFFGEHEAAHFTQQ